MKLNATVCFCIDFELALGMVQCKSGDIPLPKKRLLNGRKAMESILQLMDKHEITATWATVGHLFLHSCSAINGKVHPEIIRAEYSWFDGDWFSDDPVSNVKHAPLWYASDLIKKIRSSQVRHEIGSHSFSHIVFDDHEISLAAAESDFESFSKAAKNEGLEPLSFVYPTHKQGYKELLLRYNFKIYRGETTEPYVNMQPKLRRIMRLFMRLFSIPSSPSQPVIESNGLVHLPASMHFALRAGRLGNIESGTALARRAIKGLDKTVDQGGVFTIYFHDHNFGFREAEHLEALENVFSYVAKLRKAGNIEVKTMADIYHSTKGVQ